MTPHITAKKEQIASIVLMPGDPLRAKYIAEKFLTDVQLVNETRNMLMFTGTYQGVQLTIASSGMGNPSVGIYSYELFKFYDVKTIIRIGTAGSTDPEIKVNDVVIVHHSVGDSDYQKIINGIDSRKVKPTPAVNEALVQAAKELSYEIKEVGAHSTDNFYRQENNLLALAKANNTSVEEMETYALFSNAIATGKQAGALLTISDEIISGEALSAEERQNNLDKMATLVLKATLNLK
jgi:purine-nucleoside phosphorylase